MFAQLSLLQGPALPGMALRRSLTSLRSFTGRPATAQGIQGSHLQREIFAAEDSGELLNLLRSAAHNDRFDPASLVAASQRLSHLGSSRSKAELDDVPGLLEEAALEHLQHFSVDQVSGVLTSLARLAPAHSRQQALLNRAATVSTAAVLHEACTEHNVSLMVAFADLGAGDNRSPQVDSCVRRLTAELHSRVVDGPVLHRTPIADAQLPALSWSIARLHASPRLVARYGDRGVLPAPQPSRPPAPSAADKTPSDGTDDTAAAAAASLEVAGFMDSIASRARSHLANRHSAKATFAPGEVASLAASYALLDHYSVEVASLMDAVLGFATRRILSKHLNAISRLDHTAKLLWAIALLQHRSVATRELLQASATEIAHKLAATAQQPQSDSSELGDLVAILAAHWTLGFQPASKLLVALPPFACRRASTLTAHQAADLRHMLHQFGHPPGPVLQELLDVKQTPEQLA